MKKTSILMAVVMMLLNISCVQPVYQAPYVLNGPESLLGSAESFFSYAGVFAQIHNTSEKDIALLEIGFDVFDRTTKKNPFTGSNHITSTFAEIVYAGDTAELCISLDSYIHAVPKETYIISNFCINSITYTDGSRWIDYLCSYNANSN